MVSCRNGMRSLGVLPQSVLRFAAKRTLFCGKTQSILRQNADCFAAKRYYVLRQNAGLFCGKAVSKTEAPMNKRLVPVCEWSGLW